jgi:hypothetical protein
MEKKEEKVLDYKLCFFSNFFPFFSNQKIEKEKTTLDHLQH